MIRIAEIRARLIETKLGDALLLSGPGSNASPLLSDHAPYDVAYLLARLDEATALLRALLPCSICSGRGYADHFVEVYGGQIRRKITCPECEGTSNNPAISKFLVEIDK